MAPLHLVKGVSTGSANTVDIQLDKDFVSFEGTAHEALAAYLSGHLVLRINEPLTVKYIRLHLTGVRRVSLPTKSGWGKTSSEEKFYSRSWEFHDACQSSPQLLPSGECKFPFNVVLDGSLPESVEGVKEASVVYTFTAEIGRKHGKPIIFCKPLRVIRVADTYVHEQALDETWLSKLAYRLFIPNTHVAFGTSIEMNYSFIPLLRGLKIDYIESQVLEFREFAFNGADVVSGRDPLTVTVLSSDTFTMDDTAEDTIKGADGYQFVRRLHLPRTLGQCLQDADMPGVRIKHKIRVVVRMSNPDGHPSELRLRIPMSVYLSAQYRVWEGPSYEEVLPSPEILGLNDEVPPAYGKHELDRLVEAQALSA
ncbi:arrestin family protein [Aspergillus stella-maris]|uniref:arrestin family protein n=1 Tax=Aspergillus stella-maris TaxID=1810926 RepID=UPI003CCCFC02